MRILFSVMFLLATPVMAQMPDLRVIVDDHILPKYTQLTAAGAQLSAAAEEDCSPENPALITAYHDAFDAWIAVSHLRFGPSEHDDRAFALAFWPDPRGKTPKALAGLIRDQDPIVNDSEEFADVSIAARGFYALERLLFDPQFTETEAPEYTCTLVQAIALDIHRNAAAILEGWAAGFGDLISNPGNDTYRNQQEATAQVFTALTTGLEFTTDARLGRPLGTFERPRPNRAEARRSERSLRHVLISLQSTRELAALISGGDDALDAAYARVISRAETLDEPVFAGVSEPQSRLRIEILQQNIGVIRELLRNDIGPRLGIAAGFNALDGD